MRTQLYLTNIERDWLKSTIKNHVDIFCQKLMPPFSSIDDEAKEHAEKYFDELSHRPSDSENGDLSVIAEEAQVKEMEYAGFLYWGKYCLTATWHVMLYQLWE